LAQNIFIDGIGISSYRSFGPEIQRIGPFEKINLFIGQNNSGKSNILLFLHQHYRNAAAATLSSEHSTLHNSTLKFEELDKHLGQNVGKRNIAFGLRIKGEKYTSLIEACSKQIGAVNVSVLIEQILKSKSLTQEGNIAWFHYSFSHTGNTPLSLDKDLIQSLKNEEIIEPQKWSALWSNLTHGSNGDIDKHWIPQIIQLLIDFAKFSPPPIDLIPAIRQIKKELSAENDHSGSGLIEELAKLQNPEYNRQDLKDQFEKINEFLKEVIGNRTARLEIPYERNMILVHIDGRTLPLSSLGTGIHEVIILAAKATVMREQILCIEELELHLHPLLQKKLIRYLAEKTDNQYFITTHSAHLLDTPGAAIFHVRHSEGVSKVESVYTTFEKSHICADLGYRASDLLQANYIVWVEGPSDRIYVNHWINAIAPELIEGLHYSIMFYGGRLLSHLSAEERDVEDQEVDKLIKLRSLNRNISIVIDSDRERPKIHINKTKQRIVKELNTNTGFAWVTKGREIENYVEPELLKEAVKKVHKNAVSLQQTGQFDHCLPYVTDKKEVKTVIDKVKVAHEVAGQPVNLEVLDLKSNVQKLVDFIRKSNDFNEGFTPEA
jgi:predicted ATP-dependent endonuclease of OLD family